MNTLFYFKSSKVRVEGFEPSISWLKTKRLRPLDDTPINLILCFANCDYELVTVLQSGREESNLLIHESKSQMLIALVTTR
jgi:hypothetical protein